MARKSTIKLLLVNESDNAGERLISLFRNAGRVARAQRASSLEALRKLLDAEPWDLLIASDQHPEISVAQALEQVQKASHPLPALALTDAEATPLLEAGASDVVASDDEQRLVLAAFRELQHLEHYRELVDVRARLADAEERSALLMQQSQDAIAYVSDGMLVSCNALFAQRFGYEDPDDLDCAPVIDLIDSADQDKFKGLLKAQLASEEGGSTDFAFTGVKHGGDSFAASMQLSNAVLDEEPCVQLAVRDPGAEPAAGGSGGDTDYLTGLRSTPYLLSQLDSAAKQAAAGTGDSTLLVVGISHYAELRRQHGFSAMGRLMSELSEIVSTNCDSNTCVARCSDDGFALLVPDTDVEQARSLAGTLREAIGQHSMALDGDSLQVEARIGLVGVDAQREAHPEAALDDGFSALEAAREADDDSGVAVFEPARERKSLGDAGSDDELDKILEDALENDECFLIFQPVVSLRGTTGDHYEVQTHMLQEDGTEIDTEEFLQSLHFSGVNTRLDRWIILEATKQLAAQIDAGNDTRLFINLTANALRDESLIAWLGVALKAGGIPAGALAFQFQEAELKAHQEAAQAFADGVGKLGCKIAIAGFGAGEDPIDTLKQLKADFAKIDTRYTEELLQGGDAGKLKEMVALINENEAQAIISGVENAAALAQLWQLGVDFIQGAYLAGPSREMDYEFTDIA